MAEFWYYVNMVVGILIATFSQLILKKAAMRHYKSWIYEYLNVLTIIGYGMMFLSTVCSLIAHKVVPVSMAPVWNSCSFILVALVSRIFLHEIPSRKKLIGLGIMVVGIIVFSL